MNDLATNAPPNASKANNALSMTIVDIFLGSIPAKFSMTLSLGALA